MKTFTNKKGKEILLIEVNDELTSYSLEDYKGYLSLYYAGGVDNNHLKLPKGNYQIIGLAKDVSEEVAARIIDKVTFNLYTNYLDPCCYVERQFYKATESLSSLIQSKGLNNNVLILEKVN